MQQQKQFFFTNVQAHSPISFLKPIILALHQGLPE